MIRRLRLIVAPSVILLAVPAHAGAATIHVSPTTGTLQAAIDAAASGDTIRVHAGTYSETIRITKPLHIVGDGAADVMIDGGCGTLKAMEVLADDVVLKGVAVTGGTQFTLDVDGRDRVAIVENIVLQSCGSEAFGINVFHSTNIRVLRNQASGYGDAGIYVGGTDPAAHVVVARNTSSNNVRGMLVEGVPIGGENVLVELNRMFSNTSAGIFLEEADGVRIRNNIVKNNASYGIFLDNSDENRVIGNRISGSLFDAVDAGASNCWKQNTYTTSTLGTNGCP